MQTLTEVAVEVHADMRRVKPEAVAGAQIAGRAAGDALGDTIARGADGRLREQRGTFVAGGAASAKAFSGGFKSGIDGTFAKVAATMAARFALMGGAAAAAAPGVAQLAGALVPAAGAALALPAALLAIRAASAVVRVAVMGVGDAITTGFGDNAKQASEALNQLHGNAREFAKQVISLRPQVESLKNTISDRFFLPLLDDVKPLAQTYLPLLRAGVGNLAGPLGGLGEQVAESVRSWEAFTAVRMLLDQTGRAVVQLRGAIDPLTQALANLLIVTLPELPKLASGFSNAAARAGAFITEASQTGRVTAAFEAGKQVLRDLGGILGNVGSIISSVYRAATANGNALLGNLRDLTGQAAAFLRSAEGGSAMVALFGTLGALGGALRTGLGAVLPAIGESIRELAPALTALAGPAAQLVVAVAPLLPFVAGLAAQVARVLTPAVAALSGWLAQNERVVKAVAVALAAYVAVTKVAAAVTAVQAAGGLAKWVAQTVIATNVTRIFTATQYALGAAMRFALGPVGLVIAAVGALVAGLVYAYKNHDGFRALVQRVWQQVQRAVGTAVAWFTGTALPWMRRVWDGIAQGAVQMWQNYIRPALSAIVGFFRDVVAPAAMWLWRNVISPAFTGVGAVIKAGIAVGQLAAAVIVAYFRNVVAPVVTWLWRNIISPAFKTIGFVIKAGIAVGQVALAAAVAYFRNVVAPVITWLWKNVVVPAFNGWKTTITTVWNVVRPVLKAVGDFITTKVAPAFKTGVGAIAKAWDALRDAARKPVEFVVRSIINPLIGGFNKIAGVFGTTKIDPIAGFAGGGMLPGRPRGYDNLLATVYDGARARGVVRVGSGEFVVNEESTSANEPLIRVINAKRGRVSRSDVDPYLDGYRDGGRVGDGLGDFLGGVWSGLKGAGRAILNPGKTLTRIANGLINQIPGGGSFRGILAGMAGRVVAGVKKWLEGNAGGAIGGAGGAESWLAKRNIIGRWFPFLRLISGVRPGATTLSGRRSLHADGLAVDYPPYRPLAERIRAVFGRQTQELITPWNDLNLLHGRPHRYTGAVWQQHNFPGGNAHVHWGARHGGLLTSNTRAAKVARADFGSVTLARGWNMIENATGRPEPLSASADSEVVRLLRALLAAMETLAPEFARAIGATTPGLLREARRR